MPFPGHPEYDLPTYLQRQRERDAAGCTTAVAGLVLMALIVWGGCMLANHSLTRHAAIDKALYGNTTPHP